MTPPRLVAFLRGINVGGHTVTMEALRDVFAGEGLADVETFIASGNVIFGTKTRNLNGLEWKLERRLHEALGFEVRTFIRTAAQVAAIAAEPPLPAARIRAAAGKYVGFLEATPSPGAVKAVLALRSPNDDVQVRGREVYWLSMAGMSGSKLSYVAFERAIGGQATFRGLNTISRLVAKYGFDGHAHP